MERLVVIKQGVIGGVEKELIESIIPSLSNSFKQRKEFFEYYFEEKFVKFSLEDLDNLSKEFYIKISEFELEIEI